MSGQFRTLAMFYKQCLLNMSDSCISFKRENSLRKFWKAKFWSGFLVDKLQMEVIGTVYCYKGRTNPILAPTLWGQPYTKFKNFVQLTSGDLKKNINNLFKVWFSKFLNIWYWTNYIPFVHYPDSIRFGQIGKFFSSALCPQSKFVSICWKSWCQEFRVDNSVWAFICISTDSRNSAKIDNDQFHSEDFRQE